KRPALATIARPAFSVLLPPQRDRIDRPFHDNRIRRIQVLPASVAKPVRLDEIEVVDAVIVLDLGGEAVEGALAQSERSGFDDDRSTGGNLPEQVVESFHDLASSNRVDWRASTKNVR
ncbi:MAG: hypothetical protein ABIQ82_12620, partial [Variovorax sp.]